MHLFLEEDSVGNILSGQNKAILQNCANLDLNFWGPEQGFCWRQGKPGGEGFLTQVYALTC